MSVPCIPVLEPEEKAEKMNSTDAAAFLKRNNTTVLLYYWVLHKVFFGIFCIIHLWWYSPVILILGRQRQHVWASFGLFSKFQAIQGCTVKPCLKNKSNTPKKTKTKQKKKPNALIIAKDLGTLCSVPESHIHISCQLQLFNLTCHCVCVCVDIYI